MHQFTHGGRARAAVVCRALALSIAATVAHSAVATAATTTTAAATGTPAAQAFVGTPYYFQPATPAIYTKTVVYAISNKPSWATFNSTSGVLSGTPAAKDVGTYSNIVISGHAGTVQGVLPTFSITVANRNTSSGTPPVTTAVKITGAPATKVVAGTTYTFTPTASVPAGMSMTFAVTNRPVWASFDPTKGRLYGTPTTTQVGSYGNISISVSDGKASAALPAFAIAVATAGGSTGTPTGPTISGSASTSVTAGSAYSFTPTASDSTAGAKLTFAVTNKPAWAAFNATTGALTGTPASTNVGTTAGIVVSVSDGSKTAALTAFSITVNPASSAGSGPAVNGAPRVLYTDQIAGPVSGGENNNGTYVSIFGTNFGSSLSNVRVYFGSTEAAAYRSIGVAKGRADIQQIVVQPGSATSGTQPIKVVVNGVSSNIDQTFMANPGDILFVDNVSGNDSTGVKNDITHPWQHVQTAAEGGAFEAAKPGDVVVMRGKSTWTDSAVDTTFTRIWSESGTAPTGSKGSGYITITGYPGETVTINAPKGGGIMGPGTAVAGKSGMYIVLSNLKIVGNPSASSDGAPINLQTGANYWRVVNNDVSWPTVSGTMLAGGVVGDGANIKVLGNRIHDIAGGTMNHGIYLDTSTANADVGYNNIFNVTGGNLIQTFDSEGGGNLTNILIHHNLIHDGGRYGLNLADGTVSGHVWNNVIYNTVYAGIRINQNGSSMSEVLEHNTLVNVNTNHAQEPGAIVNTWGATGGSIKFQFNIIAKTATATAAAYVNNASDGAITFSRNLYEGYTSAKDATAIVSDPQFVNAAQANFQLGASSPAINAATGSTVIDDYQPITRSTPDIGAYEYH